MTRYATEILERRRAAAASLSADVVLLRAVRAGERLRVESRPTDDGTVWTVLDEQGRTVGRPAEESVIAIPI